MYFIYLLFKSCKKSFIEENEIESWRHDVIVIIIRSRDVMVEHIQKLYI